MHLQMPTKIPSLLVCFHRLVIPWKRLRYVERFWRSINSSWRWSQQTIYICNVELACVPDRRVKVRQCICGCAWWLRDDVSLEQLSSLFTGAMSTCRRTFRLNIDAALPLRRYSARNDVCDMTLWLRSGIWHTHHSGDTWKHIYLGPRNRSALRYWCYTNTLTYLLTNLPSVPWHCWLGVRKSTRPVKIQRWGADVVRVRCRMFAYGPDCYWGLFNYQKTAKYAKRRAKDVTGVTSFARQKTSSAH